MSRHAFLIIAHDNFSVLDKLLRALAHPRVDIFLHIDAKIKDSPFFQKDYFHLHIIQDRVDTRWGDISQIETEYVLLETALKHGPYSYFHILSGTHFPLKPIEQILHFFDQVEGKTVFHNLCTATKYQENLKLRSYNLCTRHLGYGSPAIQRLSQMTNRLGHIIQSTLKITRNQDVAFFKASNWVSFTEDAARMLIEKKDFVFKVFKFSFCGDEFFAPTVLMNSPLKEKIINYDHYLKLEMGEANPRVLTIDDSDKLIGSGYLFARKFSDKNIDMVEQIIEYTQR